ncbi:endonuclease/exonuclease/phosphatase family protein [Candidatus Eisenbacteria bacterium]|uniref:Endonuclease/exonuclease/phosphatase family protein n=1 Tax=Eiseniibacteriota bacterium TaxID=2212470 RepID=A0ABV6YJV3_UNCEI
MASPFGKPKFAYDYDLTTEKKAFNKFFTDPNRGIPKKKKNEFDLASWNIANLGAQKRRPKDLKLIAHMLSKFDLIAVQEVNEQLDHLSKILGHLKTRGYAAVFTDPAGNDERLAVVYRKSKVRPRQLIGELDHNPNGTVKDGQYILRAKSIKVSAGGKKRNFKFYNFNRNPQLTSWEVVGRKYTFVLANVHIYWGKPDPSTTTSDAKKKKRAMFNQRIGEVFYLANWASETTTKPKKRKLAYDPNIILLGDMNIPTIGTPDLVYKALCRKGMRPTKYSTEMGTTIGEFTKYDQVVFTQVTDVTPINAHTTTVVDFDNYLFKKLWDDASKTDVQFKAWTRFAVSDHRPLFVRLKV